MEAFVEETLRQKNNSENILWKHQHSALHQQSKNEARSFSAIEYDFEGLEIVWFVLEEKPTLC